MHASRDLVANFISTFEADCTCETIFILSGANFGAKKLLPEGENPKNRH